MSYRGEVSYQQRGPPARDNYYYNGNKSIGGPPQQGQYKRINDNGSREVNYRGHDRSEQQFGQYRGQQQQDSREVNGFHDQRDTTLPAHRYPKIFQGNAQPLAAGDSSWERPSHPSPAQNWGNELQNGGGSYVSESDPNQNEYNYQDRGLTQQSPVTQGKYDQNYTNQGQYRAHHQIEPYYQQDGGAVGNRVNEVQFQNRDPYTTPNDQLSLPTWSDQNRGQSYNTQDENLLESPNMELTSGYRKNEPRRDRNSSYSDWPPTSNDFEQPYTQQGDGLSTYDQGNTPSQRQYQYNEYRDTNYRQEVQSVPKAPPEPPHVIAKTIGTTAIFGIVARGDTSSTRQNAPVTSPSRTNAPPSSTRDYTPSYDQYRDREPTREQPPPQTAQQQHQYHYALTPISEKPSPPSSISSRGYPPESSWSMKQMAEGRNQYQHHGDSGQSWHTQADRGYHDQHQGQQNRTNYNEPQNQYQDRQPTSQVSRPGYRDSEYTESSGYGSESTHYTERSYNNEQQRFSDKGQYGSRFPLAQQQQRDNWPKSPTESFSHSPPRRPEADGYREQYTGDDSRSTSLVLQQYDPRDNNREQRQNRPPDSYGPPVSSEVQRRYDDKRHSPNENRYGAQEYGRGPPPRHELRPNSPSDYTGGHPSVRHINTESRVEESHVKSVRAAKDLFEKQSDPRRPPPAPKPILAPKPNFGSIANTRPIPPHPRNLSDDEWRQQSYSNQYQPRSPQGPTSPTSPHYAPRPQQYQQRSQPSHSHSMDNLDSRSRYQSPPSHGPPVLDDRSSHRPDQIHHQGRPQQSTEPNEGYRRSYSGPGAPEERPMVLAVKYNPDTGPAIFTRQDQQMPDESWEKPQREVEPPRRQNNYRPQPQLSPTRPYSDRRSWPVQVERSTPQQSHADYSRNAAPIQPQGRSSLSENANYLPDVVTRSYDLASQPQQPALHQQTEVSRATYNGNPRQPERDSDYRHQPRESYQSTPESQNSTDRWPTPPPPISQTQPPPSQPQQANPSYTDDWRRLGPPPQQLTEPPSQRVRDNVPPHGRQPDYPSTRLQPHEYRSNDTTNLQIPPPPPHQPYPYDSDSSEVDVDAPTPPPSGKGSRPPYLTSDMRSESPYEKNKPVPLTTLNPPPDSWRRLPHQPENARQPHQKPTYSKRPSQSYQSKIPQKYTTPSVTKNPPPQKPQRNSTSLSPRTTGASDQNGFDFNMGVTHQLKHPSSNEGQRLDRSAALANQKPQSRRNLLEIENDNQYQIEVTDIDISTRATMEVHREESMRILRATKKEKESSSDPQSTVLERSLKQKAQQRVVAPPSDQESEPTTSKPAASSKKRDTKLVYKKPSADPVKTVPLPRVTEPAPPAIRRPPTYSGFGYTPEKPKTDLLTQFKSARDSSIRTAAEKQERSHKSVSAPVKFYHGKKEPKLSPKPKLAPADRNVEVSPPEKEGRSRHSYHNKHHDERGNAVRSSTRSSPTVKPEKYDGDDDTKNGARHERDRKGRGKERHRDDERAKSSGPSTSRGRDLGPEDGNGRSRRDFNDIRYNERRRRDDDSSFHRRPASPDRHRYRENDRYYQRSPQHRPHPQPYDRHRAAREPDWVEQFRQGREAASHPTRRVGANDQRRADFTADGRRRELDMDAFEREVKRATTYNSDFDQPEPRRQMIPTNLSSKSKANPKRQPSGDWMNALKEKNRNAARTRFGHVSRY